MLPLPDTTRPKRDTIGLRRNQKDFTKIIEKVSGRHTPHRINYSLAGRFGVSGRECQNGRIVMKKGPDRFCSHPRLQHVCHLFLLLKRRCKEGCRGCFLAFATEFLPP